MKYETQNTVKKVKVNRTETKRQQNVTEVSKVNWLTSYVKINSKEQSVI